MFKRETEANVTVYPKKVIVPFSGLQSCSLWLKFRVVFGYASAAVTNQFNSACLIHATQRITFLRRFCLPICIVVQWALTNEQESKKTSDIHMFNVICCVNCHKSNVKKWCIFIYLCIVIMTLTASRHEWIWFNEHVPVRSSLLRLALSTDRMYCQENKKFNFCYTVCV